MTGEIKFPAYMVHALPPGAVVKSEDQFCVILSDRSLKIISEDTARRLLQEMEDYRDA